MADQENKYIVITGAAGFIASALLCGLNQKANYPLILVDDFGNEQKTPNYANKHYEKLIDRKRFFDWAKENALNIAFVFHLGARTDTTEMDPLIFQTLNIDYSKKIWQLCTTYEIPLIYASSAATYGLGESGYKDHHEIVNQLKPLNPYGYSKLIFDQWALDQAQTPPFWAGIKFFNVYGPNEYHKGRMASVVFHAFNQIRDTGVVKLFRSHRPDYEDGMQLRDFIYIKDVVDVLLFLMNKKPASGLYNLGTGKAESFLELATQTFNALAKEPHITFVDTPLDIRDKYQYYTQADMGKLRQVGYDKAFKTLSEGVADYVTRYLVHAKYL
jgi:ADP-L-glycero-D-manno-heptose 6-epimerase